MLEAIAMRLSQLSLTRTGLVMSAAGHLLFLMFAFVHPHRQTAHGEAMAVEIVPANEVPQVTAPPETQEQEKTEKAPDFSKLQTTPPMPDKFQTQQQSQPPNRQQAAAEKQRQAEAEKRRQAEAQKQQQAQAKQQQQQQQQAKPQQQQPQQPPPPPQQTLQPWPQSASASPPAEIPPIETLEETQERLTTMLAMNLQGDGTGAEARDKAQLTPQEIAAFMTQVKRCWTLPPGVAENAHVKIIVRLSLKQDGALAGEPALIEASASTDGPPIMRSAIRALKQCAPYTTLPAAKYKEWKVLDLNFSPDALAGT
jgi:hypothetical protein